jgi:predicted RNase H-like HicB family nuclease
MGSARRDGAIIINFAVRSGQASWLCRSQHAIVRPVVDRSPSSFGITFPDFPGCTSAGTKLQETVGRGHEALAAHIELMAECHEPIPEPTPLDAIEDDGEGKIVFKTLVRVDLPDAAGVDHHERRLG